MGNTKESVTAMIYVMSGNILSGIATEEKIKKVVKLAKEHDLLQLVKQEFGDIGTLLNTGA